jgi:cytidyltransferase-related domain
MSEVRVRRYIFNLREALCSLDLSELSRRYPDLNFGGLLDAVKRYLDDAIYYANKGDFETAIAAASYAEGLLDSLKYLGLSEPRWPESLLEEVRVFVGGTFDILHPGHIELLRYASGFGKLYVVVARDVNVVRVKGRGPVLDELSRLKIVSSIRYVYEAMLGDEEDIYRSVERVKPHVIVLGPDQPFSEEEVAREVERRLSYRPTVVRFKEKIAFSGELRGSSDVMRVLCERLLGGGPRAQG